MSIATWKPNLRWTLGRAPGFLGIDLNKRIVDLPAAYRAEVIPPRHRNPKPAMFRENVTVAALAALRGRFRLDLFRNMRKMPELNALVEQTLELVNLTGRVDTPVSDLAYGEKRRLEIGLGGKDVVEDEVTGRRTVFLEEVGEVLGIAADKLDQRPAGRAQLGLRARPGTNLRDDRVSACRNLGIANARGFLRQNRRGSSDTGREHSGGESLRMRDGIIPVATLEDAWETRLPPAHRLRLGSELAGALRLAPVKRVGEALLDRAERLDEFELLALRTLAVD